MNRGLIIASAVTGVLALIFVAMAAERSFAAGETAIAVKTINSGFDWDGQTPISAEQQAERLSANVEILSSQKSQRNSYGCMALLIFFATTGTLAFWKKQQK